MSEEEVEKINENKIKEQLKVALLIEAYLLEEVFPDMEKHLPNNEKIRENFICRFLTPIQASILSTNIIKILGGETGEMSQEEFEELLGRFGYKVRHDK